MPLTDETLDRYIARYREKASVLRKIHSDRAKSRWRANLWYTVLTITAGAAITFLGFMGPDRLLESASSLRQSALPGNTQPVAFAASQVVATAMLNKQSFDFLFNVAVLVLFIASLLNLIFRWKEEYTAHFQGVVSLTKFTNWLDELRLLGIPPGDVSTVKEIRGRYQGIVEALPPNSDKDYQKAKNELAKGEGVSSTTSVDADSTDDGRQFVTELVQSSLLLMTVLRAMRSVDEGLWLGGGAIRNCVWDMLTGRGTLQDDFDVVYFDASDTTPTSEARMEDQVRVRLPLGLKVSVKNQARMHLVNGEPQRYSLAEAIENWPETATSIGVRLSAANIVEIIAPHGVDDLLGLTVRPTPYHSKHGRAFADRVSAKAWTTHWPELKVLHE